jgi:hypothetical protein
MRQTTRDSRIQAAKEWQGGNADTKKALLDKSKIKWKTAVTPSERGVLVARKGPDLLNFKIYKNLHKYQILILMQICQTGLSILQARERCDANAEETRIPKINRTPQIATVADSHMMAETTKGIL